MMVANTREVLEEIEIDEKTNGEWRQKVKEEFAFEKNRNTLFRPV